MHDTVSYAFGPRLVRSDESMILCSRWKAFQHLEQQTGSVAHSEHANTKFWHDGQDQGLFATVHGPGYTVLSPLMYHQRHAEVQKMRHEVEVCQSLSAFW